MNTKNTGTSPRRDKVSATEFLLVVLTLQNQDNASCCARSAAHLGIDYKNAAELYELLDVGVNYAQDMINADAKGEYMSPNDRAVITALTTILA